MKFIREKRFCKFAVVQAIFWGALGITLFTVQDFLQKGMFYALVGYMFVNGIWRIVWFVRRNATSDVCGGRTKYLLHGWNLVVAFLLLVAAVHSIVFRTLLIEITPVYLGGLLMLEGVLKFVTALCTQTSSQKTFLIVFSVIVFYGGAAVMVFTFGFGIGGMSGLTYASGIASMLTCLYELADYLCHRNSIEYRRTEENL